MKDRWMSAKEAVKYLGISRSTLYQWRANEGMPEPSTVGGRVYYDRIKIDEWLESKNVKD